MKFKTKIIRLSILLSITAIGIIINLYYPFHKNIGLESEIKEITKNTKIIDQNTDHNQALDVSEYAKSKGVKIPSILINFDTHSDIYLNAPILNWGQAGIENWINEYIAKNPEVDEIYWVMPTKEAANILLQILFTENNIKELPGGSPLYGNVIKDNINKTHFIFKPLYVEAYSQDFIIEPATGKMNEYIPELKISKIFYKPEIKYKNVKVITCTKNTLPDFKDKKVFLSIDADYISNSGFDTTEEWKNIQNEYQMTRSLKSMLKTLKNKNIQPEIISLSLSPQYLPKKNHKFMENFFDYLIKTSDNEDMLKTYKRKFVYDPAMFEKDKSKFGN